MDTSRFLAAYRTWAATHLPGKEAEALLGLTDEALLAHLRSAEMGEGWTDRAIGALLTVQATGGYGRIPDLAVLRGLGLITPGPPYLLTAEGGAWLAEHRDAPVERPVPGVTPRKTKAPDVEAGPKKGKRAKAEPKPKSPSKRKVREPDEADGPPPEREVVAVLPPDFLRAVDEEIVDHLAALGHDLDDAYAIYRKLGQETPLLFNEFEALFEEAKPKLLDGQRRTMRFVSTHHDAETDHPVLILSLWEGWLVLWETSDQELFPRAGGLPPRFTLHQDGDGPNEAPPITDAQRLTANPLDPDVRGYGVLRLPINTIVVLPDGFDPRKRFVITRNVGPKYHVHEMVFYRGKRLEEVSPDEVALATDQRITFDDYQIRDSYEAAFPIDSVYRALAYTQAPIVLPPLQPDADPLEYPLPLYIEATLGLRREDALEDWDEDVEEAEKAHHRALVRALLSKNWEKVSSAVLQSWIDKGEKEPDEFEKQLGDKAYTSLSDLEFQIVGLHYTWRAYGFACTLNPVARKYLLGVADKYPDLTIADVPVLVNVLDYAIEVLTPSLYRRYMRLYKHGTLDTAVQKSPIDERPSTPELFARMAAQFATGPLTVRDATHAEMAGQADPQEWASVEDDTHFYPELRGPPAAFTRKTREIGLAWLEEQRIESNQSHRQTSLFG